MSSLHTDISFFLNCPKYLNEQFKINIWDVFVVLWNLQLEIVEPVNSTTHIQILNKDMHNKYHQNIFNQVNLYSL